MLDGMLQDIRYTARQLWTHRIFAVVCITTLALGIGANTAIFSLVNTVLLTSAPYPHASRLVTLQETIPAMGPDVLNTSAADFLDYRDRNRTFQSVAGYESLDFDLTGAGEPQHVAAVRATSSLFVTLQVWPRLGRAFSPAEDVYGASRVAVLSDRFWRAYFDGNPGVLGTSIRLNERPYTIVGVMPPGFEFPATGTSVGEAPSLWVPMAFTPNEITDRAASYDVSVVARLKPGVPIVRARQDVERIAREFQREHPDVYNGNVWVRPALEVLGAEDSARARPALLMLSAAVLFVLLVACANAANLLLSRAVVRQREFAVRSALGAATPRLIRQLLTESIALTLCGGLFGCLLAWGILGLAARLSPDQILDLRGVHIDLRVLLFTLILSGITGILCGLAPAMTWARPNLWETLKQAGRRLTSGRHGNRVRGALVIVEVASAVILLIAASLLIRSFLHVLQVPPGFHPNGVTVIRTSFNRQRYPKSEQRRGAELQIMHRLSVLPGVSAVALTTHIPLADDRGIGFVVEGRDRNEFHWADNALVSGDYFRVMGIPLYRGRTFDSHDTPQNPIAAVVNQTMARMYWPSQNPIGKRILWGGRPLTVVGVVADAHLHALDRTPRPAIYNSVFQVESGAATSAVFILRSSAPNLAGAARRAIWSVDSGLPVFETTTMNRVVARSLAARRFTTFLLIAFAALALILAVFGLYGILSYTVAQRAPELGIRLALGAEPGKLMWLVIRDGLRLTVAGSVAGLIGGAFVALAMSRFLFGIRSLDVASFAGSVLVLLLTSVLASYIPAREAAGTDPMTTLRAE